MRIVVGEKYTEELDHRMVRLKISRNELARESGINRRQLTRWFNESMQPSMKNVARIEEAILKIRAERVKKRKRASK